ncbi:MAG TPA: hypothetical protein VEH77_04830 [Roseiarcus sp.]|nr:hypothetical protein [Roseiarcus sp.]
MAAIYPDQSAYEPVAVVVQADRPFDLQQPYDAGGVEHGIHVAHCAVGATPADIRMRMEAGLEVYGRLAKRRIRQSLVKTTCRTCLAQTNSLLQGDFAFMKVHPPDDQTRCAHKIEHHSRERYFQIVLVADVDQGGDAIDDVRRDSVCAQTIPLLYPTVFQLNHRRLASTNLPNVIFNLAAEQRHEAFFARES